MTKTSEELFTANTHPQISEGLRLTAHQGKHNPYNSLVDSRDRGNGIGRHQALISTETAGTQNRGRSIRWGDHVRAFGRTQ